MDLFNIYTGEKVNDVFEQFGFEKFSDDSKKIYLKYGENEKTFEYITNTEYTYNDLKFVICRKNDEDLVVLFNVEMNNNSKRRLRGTFADTWKYFKSAYGFKINEILEFEYLDQNIKICIK